MARWLHSLDVIWLTLLKFGDVEVSKGQTFGERSLNPQTEEPNCLVTYARGIQRAAAAFPAGDRGTRQGGPF